MTILLLLFLFAILSGQDHPSTHQLMLEKYRDQIINNDIIAVRTGLDIILSDSLHLIAGKRLALVTNQSGVDADGIPNYRRLMALPQVEMAIIFSPEHGLFGEASAGESVQYNAQDSLPRVVSLYGKTRKPASEMLADVDLILYDIQDIGARFYTYISTLGLVMEAAAENRIPVIVLDRPNPIRGDRIEGPLLHPEFKSFVGYYPLPIQYGLTVGELARLIQQEEWINPMPSVSVIPCAGWIPNLWYDETTLPWIKPSPNIPNLTTAIVYPGLCFLEAVNVNEGRGTLRPFLQFGAPWINDTTLARELNQLHLPGIVFSPVRYTPVSLPGMSENPRYQDEECRGVELAVTDRNQFQAITAGISIIHVLATLYPDRLEFNEKWFSRLWGDSDWRRYVENPTLVHEINLTEYETKIQSIRLY